VKLYFTSYNIILLFIHIAQPNMGIMENAGII